MSGIVMPDGSSPEPEKEVSEEPTTSKTFFDLLGEDAAKVANVLMKFLGHVDIKIDDRGILAPDSVGQQFVKQLSYILQQRAQIMLLQSTLETLLENILTPEQKITLQSSVKEQMEALSYRLKKTAERAMQDAKRKANEPKIEKGSAEMLSKLEQLAPKNKK